MKGSQKPAQVIAAKDGPALSVAGGSYRIVISGKETDGAYAVIEMLVPPGGGPGPHSHAAIEESFHILEGEVELKTELGNQTATAGSFINIPFGGLVHCFKNTGSSVARLWCVVVPAGLEEFFKEVAQPGVFGQFVPPQPMTEEMKARIGELAKKHGQVLYPPDYLDKK